MIYQRLLRKTALLLSLILMPFALHAQVTQADYERAASLRTKSLGVFVLADYAHELCASLLIVKEFSLTTNSHVK
jgi:hypothetical protein